MVQRGRLEKKSRVGYYICVRKGGMKQALKWDGEEKMLQEWWRKIAVLTKQTKTNSFLVAQTSDTWPATSGLMLFQTTSSTTREMKKKKTNRKKLKAKEVEW